MKKLIAFMVMAVLIAGGITSSVLAKENGSLVRVLHASPDAPAVDIYVDGSEVVKGEQFKDNTDYVALSAGDHKVEIYAAGTKGEKEPVLAKTVTTEAGKAYTVAAINKLAELELIAAEDARKVTDKKAKVRVGHLSPDAPTVDVGLVDGDTLFSGASFPTITDYKELDPGTYDLEIRTPEGVQVLDLSGTTLDKNTAYSVFAVNTADKLEVIVLEDYRR